MPGESWRYGDMTTMPSGRIRHSETRRHCKRAERLSNLRAPRPARLPKPKPMIIKIKPADSRYERGTDGGQVRRDDGFGRQTAEGAGRRERKTEEALGRADA